MKKGSTKKEGTGPPVDIFVQEQLVSRPYRPRSRTQSKRNHLIKMVDSHGRAELIENDSDRERERERFVVRQIPHTTVVTASAAGLFQVKLLYREKRERERDWPCVGKKEVTFFMTGGHGTRAATTTTTPAQ